MTDLTHFLTRAEQLLERLERLLPTAPAAPDWHASTAFRWRRKGNAAALQPIPRPHQIRLDNLQDIDDKKERIVANTRQFLAGKRANNVLLTGARGTGKSSLVKALLTEFADQGLRLIEVDKDDLIDLADIVELVEGRPERFIIFTDDLSFEDGEPAYKALKSVLDGSVAAVSDNVLIYATSNRRHLMPEYFDENAATKHKDGEVHPAEAVEEKISLSERFGLWISFYPFSQDEYLKVVNHWLGEFGVPADAIPTSRGEALQWALMRGARSGRVAWQFARDYAGRFEA
ncbi:ATP-binding protein [Zoogloea oleivorans]|uniref:ATP-binding protein n=1 Tax=Zoogloea oleivorans TaxID=1552750 RepID=A0A6C2CK26_9RHOO|nr:ATP-binding protein [Zoogloea oleivorans]TYC54600.1 ATP-binding protein [Zoogloea oleivorans]